MFLCFVLLTDNVMKILQINAYDMRYFDALVDFLEVEQPDIVFTQEFARGTLSNSQTPIEETLKKRCGLDVYLWIRYGHDDGAWITWDRGNAILTRWPIVEHQTHYFPAFWWCRTYTSQELWLKYDLTVPTDRLELYKITATATVIICWCDYRLYVN